MKTIACLHAHHSNIDYIEQAFKQQSVQLQHFVDPGVMFHVQQSQLEVAKKHVAAQLEWIASTKPDVLLVTCTNYIALIDEVVSIPVVAIDVPFFEVLQKQQSPITLFFTNPHTVEGTMKRLKQFVSQPVDIVIIREAFELLMAGNKEAYADVVMAALHNAPACAAVAQLSMVDAANERGILQPLQPVVAAILKKFG